ncbi:50S ribosomal protein L29 [Neorickettsia sp. 179522]|nr:50S ribosomal protein L29 [Neorickettsia sp. 179522]
MRMSDIRARSSKELMELLSSMRAELFTIHLKVSSSEPGVRSTSKRFIRRDIARILTCLRESKGS